ncbi:polysaccharide biosynthesis C-terminal domain-containing protein [Rhodoplanes sp. TEM]|uniref:Polysaccharide biosynthesis C-terminal domain-containing protein n=1 Tax=Rhodoplanes tepidamans TaxID=200616 RepID=A0ABT5J6G2_RHOTP|nr:MULTISPECIES: polysaccharide biosynthesis C-terminal domain-containing protein [Rhodoplanes]MDC7785233.1 polysaccharide biosynthesis C-terminal domain-containing protein [Rhodoplanes tepidamans]MDC7986415.1 polysaccharide biosynthesis C-terminal domain-containing protein [Rhodoplanes sp. TEM]MDQ0353491.1 O-antigen/teichoic acid export membrane protein [Rhodoplanes tepidamans]
MPSNLARNSVLGALAGSATTLGSFLSGVVVARALGAEGSGVVSYAVWLVLMAVPVVDLGTSSAVVRYVSELRGRGEADQARRISQHLLRVLTASVAAVAVIALATGLLLRGTPTTWIVGTATGPATAMLGPLIVAFVAAQAFGAFNLAYLRGLQDFGTIARLSLASFVLQIVGVTAGSLLFGVVGAVAGYAAGQVLSAAAAARRLSGSGGPPDDMVRDRVRRFSRYAWAANITNALVWSRAEFFFLERAWGHEAVAMFAVALALTALASQGPLLLTTGVLSFFAEQHGRREETALMNAMATGTRLLAALAFPACLGMAAVMPLLLPLVYGDAFTPAVPAAIILACAAAVGVTSVMATNLVQAVERNDFVFFSSLFGAALALAAGLLLVPAFGVIGAAVSRTVIQLAMVTVGLWFVVTRLKCPVPFGALGRLAIAAAVAALVALAVVAAARHAAALPVAVAAAVGAYIVALRATRALPEADIALLLGLAGRLPVPLRATAGRVLAFVRG